MNVFKLKFKNLRSDFYKKYQWIDTNIHINIVTKDIIRIIKKTSQVKIILCKIITIPI